MRFNSLNNVSNLIDLFQLILPRLLSKVLNVDLLSLMEVMLTSGWSRTSVLICVRQFMFDLTLSR